MGERHLDAVEVRGSKPLGPTILYFITPEVDSLPALVEITEKALEGGVDVVQYRAKRKEIRIFYEEAKVVNSVCKKYGVPFIVNDRVDIALAVGADGVHVGDKDLHPLIVRRIVGKNFIIGFSTHSLSEVLSANGLVGIVDYLGFGPIFHTKTKEDARKPVGTEKLEKVLRISKLPVVAIGGINIYNVEEVIAKKPFGIAVSSGIYLGDPYENAKKLKKLIQGKR